MTDIADLYAKDLAPGDGFTVLVGGVRCVAVVNWTRQETALKLGSRLSIRVGFDLVMPGAPGCVNTRMPGQESTLEVLAPITLTAHSRKRRNDATAYQNENSCCRLGMEGA
mgnify:CR=1 FL=1